MRKLKKYLSTKFKAPDSVYSKPAADYAVVFIEPLDTPKLQNLVKFVSCEIQMNSNRRHFELLYRAKEVSG
ncbi:MAG: hypothetical protein RSF73_09210 [Ruthenibacterium sp.]